MHRELLVAGQRHLVNLAAADQRDEAAAGQLGVAPVGEAL